MSVHEIITKISNTFVTVFNKYSLLMLAQVLCIFILKDIYRYDKIVKDITFDCINVLVNVEIKIN